MKVGHDHEYAGHIEKKILEEGYSPGAVLGVTNKDLLRKKKKKQNQKRTVRPPRGESIENRPKEVESGKTPGHWEIDCVERPKGGSQKRFWS